MINVCVLSFVDPAVEADYKTGDRFRKSYKKLGLLVLSYLKSRKHNSRINEFS